MSKRKVKITVEGWRPWQEHQKSGVSIDIDKVIADAAEAGTKYEGGESGILMSHLRAALQAVYRHEEQKAGHYCKCPHCGEIPRAIQFKTGAWNPLTFAGADEKALSASDIKEE